MEKPSATIKVYGTRGDGWYAEITGPSGVHKTLRYQTRIQAMARAIADLENLGHRGDIVIKG